MITSTCRYIAFDMTLYIPNYRSISSTFLHIHLFQLQQASSSSSTDFLWLPFQLTASFLVPLVQENSFICYHPALNQTCYTFALAHSVPKYLLKVKDVYSAFSELSIHSRWAYWPWPPFIDLYDNATSVFQWILVWCAPLKCTDSASLGKGRSFC